MKGYGVLWSVDVVMCGVGMVGSCVASCPGAQTRPGYEASSCAVMCIAF